MDQTGLAPVAFFTAPKAHWSLSEEVSKVKFMKLYGLLSPPLKINAKQKRCLVRDKVVACRKKDSEIRDLKEKIMKLSSYGRQLEKQKTELIQKVKSQSQCLKVKKAYNLDLMDHNHDNDMIIVDK